MTRDERRRQAAWSKLLEHVAGGAHLELFGPDSMTPALPCVGRLESKSGAIYACAEAATVEQLVPMLLERWECVIAGDTKKLLELMTTQEREKLAGDPGRACGKLRGGQPCTFNFGHSGACRGAEQGRKN